MNKFHLAITVLVASMIACQTLSGVPQQPPAIDPPSSIQIPTSSTGGCATTLGNYDLPHSATSVGGKELYDLAKTEPSNTYLSVSAIVTEVEHLLSKSDGVDGTIIYAHIDDIDGVNVSQYFLTIYLPDGGLALGQISAESTISASGLYVGYVYPPKNLFKVFPNEKQDTKFPSIKAEFAAYGCS